MKLLQSFKEAFESVPTDGNIRKFLHEQLKTRGPEKFLGIVTYWYGGRSYNQFLDYGLFALKVATICKRVANRDPVHCTVDFLLYDDRHDLYQNIPFFFDAIFKTNPELEIFIANAWIESFNAAGTGDTANTFCIRED